MCPLSINALDELKLFTGQIQIGISFGQFFVLEHSYLDTLQPLRLENHYMGHKYKRKWLPEPRQIETGTRITVDNFDPWAFINKLY